MTTGTMGTCGGTCSAMAIPMDPRCLAWLAGLIILNLTTLVLADTTHPGIHVTILGIRNSTGTVACALFESPEGFPTEFLRSATNIMMMKVRAARARCDFENISPGTYALAVIHDENMDGKLATNWMGVPTEGYGFSNDAKSFLAAPSFAAASFQYDAQAIERTITLND